MDYWIATHWPIPVEEPLMSRHVFVQDHQVLVPKPGDIIFIRESQTVQHAGKRVRTVVRHYLGQQATLKVPDRGYGGIIGTAVVEGERRRQLPADVLIEYGNMRKFGVIPCRNFQTVRLPMDRLKSLLGVKGLIFLDLWRIPDDTRREALLSAIRAASKSD